MMNELEEKELLLPLLLPAGIKRRGQEEKGEEQDMCITHTLKEAEDRALNDDSEIGVVRGEGKNELH